MVKVDPGTKQLSVSTEDVSTSVHSGNQSLPHPPMVSVYTYGMLNNSDMLCVLITGFFSFSGLDYNTIR